MKTIAKQKGTKKTYDREDLNENIKKNIIDNVKHDDPKNFLLKEIIISEIGLCTTVATITNKKDKIRQ